MISNSLLLSLSYLFLVPFIKWIIWYHTLFPQLLKKIKIPTELSEDVKSAIAGTYKIPDEIRKIYDTAVKEQRKFDSRANNPR